MWKFAENLNLGKRVLPPPAVEGDCNAYALIAVNAPIMRMADFHVTSFTKFGSRWT